MQSVRLLERRAHCLRDAISKSASSAEACTMSGSDWVAAQAGCSSRQGCWHAYSSDAPSSTSTAAATAATAAAAALPAPNKSKPAKGKKAAKQAADQGGGGAGTSTSGTAAGAAAVQQLQQLVEQFRQRYSRSRSQELYDRVLVRELMLKKNMRHILQAPRVKRVDVVIHAKETWRVNAAAKWRMLLPALGLEYLTGSAATFVEGSSLVQKDVSSVKVSLTGARALDFLEKLALLVLPNQVGFDGFKLSSLDARGHLHFMVHNLLAYPDFEEVFDVFEGMKGMQVTVLMEHVRRHPHNAALLLTGLSLPMQVKKKPAANAAHADTTPAHE